MKTDNIQYNTNLESSLYNVLQTKKQDSQNSQEIKNNDIVSISPDAKNKLKDAIISDYVENKSKTKMSLENIDGTVVYQFRDKETNETIKEIPSENAREQSKRISDFLSKIEKDLLDK